MRSSPLQDEKTAEAGRGGGRQGLFVSSVGRRRAGHEMHLLNIRHRVAPL